MVKGARKKTSISGSSHGASGAQLSKVLASADFEAICAMFGGSAVKLEQSTVDIVKDCKCYKPGTTDSLHQRG